MERNKQTEYPDLIQVTSTIRLQDWKNRAKTLAEQTRTTCFVPPRLLHKNETRSTCSEHSGVTEAAGAGQLIYSDLGQVPFKREVCVCIQYTRRLKTYYDTGDSTGKTN